MLINIGRALRTKSKVRSDLSRSALLTLCADGSKPVSINTALWKSAFCAALLIAAASQTLAAGLCRISTLKQIQGNIEALSPGQIESFLGTLDKSCMGNVEFSEWSNELTFSVLTNNPVVFVELLHKQSRETLSLVMEILESPVHDGIDLQKAYTAVKSARTTSATKKQVLDSLQVAAGKYGVSLK